MIKHLLFCCFLLVQCSQLLGQHVEMMPVGAKQIHFYQRSQTIEEGIRSVHSVGMDTVGGYVFKRMAYTGLSGPYGIVQRGDSIFYFHPAGGNPPYFAFKNNFSLGETTKINQYFAVITAIDTLWIDTFAVRRFTLEFQLANSPYKYIYDRFGPENGFIGWCGHSCDENYSILCRYEDPAFPQIELGTSCASYLPTTDPFSYPKLTVAPNPSQSQVSISGTEEQTGQSYVVYNSIGQIVAEGKVNIWPLELSVTAYPVGQYWIRLGTAVAQFLKY